MSQEESLRLAAEVVDKFTKPMRAMRDALIKLGEDTKKTHAAGAKDATKHAEAFGSLGKSIAKVDESVRSSLTPALAAFGVTTLTVAGAVATLKSTVFGFGETTRQLSFLSRETGLSIQRLRELDALSRRLDMSPGVMRQGTRQFAQHMHDLRLGLIPELRAWQTTLNPALVDFARGISQLPIDEALSKALGELGHIRDQHEKRTFLQLLGLPQNLADVPLGDLRKLMEDIHKNIGVLGPGAQKNALAFENAMDRLGDSIDRLKMDVGTDLANAFGHATDSIREFIDENRGGLVGAIREVATQIELFLKDVREIKKEYDDLRGGNYSDLTPHIIPGSPADKARNGFEWLQKHGDWGQKFKNWFGGGNAPASSSTPFFSPMAYHPGMRSGGGYQLINAAYTPDAGAGAGGSPEQIIAAGTKVGVLDALREFFASFSSAAGGGGGGVIPASFGGSSGAASIGNALRHNYAGGGSSGGVPSPRGGGAIGPGTDIAASKGGVASSVVAAWRAAGMSDAGIAGILGNVQQESNFNPRSRHPDQPRFGGEAHFAHGLYQEGGTEWNNYAAWIKKYHPGADWRDPALQSVFAAENLKKNYSGVWARLKNAHSPEDAARIYERGYEKPAPWAANEAGRMHNARKFFGHMPGAGDALGLGKQGAIAPTSAPSHAHLHVQFQNAPRGMRTAMKADGIFQAVSINRGLTMVPASQDN